MPMHISEGRRLFIHEITEQVHDSMQKIQKVIDTQVVVLYIKM